MLNEIGDQLVVVHGQSDQQRLRSAIAQREALDRFAGPELAHVLRDYQDAYSAWHDDSAELVRLREAHDAGCARPTSCAPIDEIESVDPQPGEDAELQERAERLSNLEELRLAAAQARSLVSADEIVDDTPDAVALVEAARRHARTGRRPRSSPRADPESLTNAGFLLADAAAELASYLAGLDADGARELEIVQERRAELAGLVRRHGATLDDVLEFRRNGGLRLVELDGDDDRIAELEAAVVARDDEVDRLASRLTAARVDAAARLAVVGHRRAVGARDARCAAHGRRSTARESRRRTGATRWPSCCSPTPAPNRDRSRAARPVASSRA